jgi:uncharacterized protein
MRYLFIFLITLYQKYISPYKGFRCAYAEFTRRTTTSALSEAQMTLGHLSSKRISDNSVNDRECYHGSLSCSAIIKNIIAKHGLLAGWPLIKHQFKQCQIAYNLLINDDEQPPPQNESSCYNELKKEAKECAQEASCRCVGEIGSDCVPDLNCSLLRLRLIKKSIHSSHIKPNKYDIKPDK